MRKEKLIESGIEKIVRKVLKEESGKKWLSRRQYQQARKGIEMLANSLFVLQNLSVDDPAKQEKQSTYNEVRKHMTAIREIIDQLV